MSDQATAESNTRNRPQQQESPAQRILRQALEAALFEGLIDYVYVPTADHLWGTVYFSVNGLDFRCGGRVRGFSRVRLQIPSLNQVHSTHRSTSVAVILKQLLNELSADNDIRKRFEHELAQTHYWCEWNKKNLPIINDRCALTLAELEMAMHEGHPYHPCFKARIGFSDDDHRRYSPESGRAINPHWIAVPKQYTHASGRAQDSEAFLRRELGDDTYMMLRTRAQLRGLDPDTISYIPVHPWQWQQCLHERLLTADITLVDLGQPGDDYWVTQSVRTLMNRAAPTRADLKLPLSIVNTSAPRYLLSHGIDSGPRLSQWIYDTVQQDPFFNEIALIVLREYAGIRVNEAALIAGSDPEICELGALWRESVTPLLQPNENAAPLMALALIEADGKPFIDSWVNHYGLEPWLEQLLKTLILPVWHLLANHGIALEAHGQNTLLLHTDGWPIRLAARDFHESVEYVNDYLAQPDRAPTFINEPRYAHAKPNEYYWMTSVEALRELVMDTLFVFHLSELAHVCEEHYQLPETQFWAKVDNCLAQYHAGQHCDSTRLSALGHQAPQVQVESLLRKKLCPNGHEYHHLVANPLKPFYSHTTEVSDAVLPRR